MNYEDNRCSQFSTNNGTWTELAAFLCYANLLARWTGQWWTLFVRVEPVTGEAAVETVALHAMLRRDSLAVIVEHSVEETLLWG